VAILDDVIRKLAEVERRLDDLPKPEVVTGPVSGSGVNTRVAFWTGTNTLGSDAGFEYILATNSLGVGVTPATNLHVYEDNTDTLPAVRIEQDGTGDAALHYILTGAQSWTTGIDNSDGDRFKIAAGAATNSNTAISVETGGNTIVSTAATTASAQLHVEQESSTAAEPVLLLDQSDISEEFIRFIGTAAGGVLTQSIVDDGDVTTSTLVGWVKVYVQDDGNQIADQAYYVPLYTLV